MVLVSVVVWLSAFLVFTTCFFPLVVVQAKSALSAVESIIEDEWKVKPTLSQALYVATPKHTGGSLLEEIHPSQFKPTPSTAINETMKERMKIFNTSIDYLNVSTNGITTTNVTTEATQFTVQRTPDGKLIVVVNKIEITPSSEPIPVNGQQTVSPSNGSNGVGDIVFPDGKPVPVKRKDLKCKRSNEQHFCTEVENYPTALLESILLAESKKYELLFGDDTIPTPVFNVTQRIDVPGEESLCNSEERLIYPQSGITKDNNLMLIINQGNFTQGIRVEECSNAGTSCRMSDNFPNGYRTECKQKYVYRQLVSLDSNVKIVKELFKIPSCCKCVLYH